MTGSASKQKASKLISQIAKRYSTFAVWQDFITMSAISIANVFDGPWKSQREQTYKAHAERYTQEEMALFGTLFHDMVMELEKNPNQDYLGELYMSLELGNKWTGQFFTPYNVCKAMAEIQCDSSLKERIRQEGWIAVNDPACGAGALLVAVANQMRETKVGVNYQQNVLFTAQDIDELAAYMCYIQLSLHGCPGYVIIGDTLMNPGVTIDRRGLIPVEDKPVWYTPMYYSDVWQWRRVFSMMNLGRRGKDTGNVHSRFSKADNT